MCDEEGGRDMIRIICREQDCGVAANVGGEVVIEYKTFTAYIPALEKWLRAKGKYNERMVVGAECVDVDIDGNEEAGA